MEGGDKVGKGEDGGPIATWLNKHRQLYLEATRHPFILSIKHGSVDISSFKRWLVRTIKQSYQYHLHQLLLFLSFISPLHFLSLLPSRLYHFFGFICDHKKRVTKSTLMLPVISFMICEIQASLPNMFRKALSHDHMQSDIVKLSMINICAPREREREREAGFAKRLDI